MVEPERIERGPGGALSIILLTLIAMLALTLAGDRCYAAGAPNLRELLFGRHANDPTRSFVAPTVARYEGDSGRAFILDRTQAAAALLQFDGDPEIWVLTAKPGPHGDVIYRNDLGQPMLRSTRLGGVTLFTSGRPSGMPAAFVGEAPAPHQPPVLGPDALFQLEVRAALRATRAAQHSVGFDTPDDFVTPASEVVFAQAFFITAEAFVRVSQKLKPAQSAISRIVLVRFVTGPKPDAAVKGSIMRITVAPELGVAGRPSSDRLFAILCRR